MIELKLPSRVVAAFCAMTRENPAHIGADRLVPPIQHAMTPLPPSSCAQKTPGEFGLAISAISGTSRTPSFGTPDPL